MNIQLNFTKLDLFQTSLISVELLFKKDPLLS
jgi:hypothetical protein